MFQPVVRSDDTIMHIGRMLRVVEEHEFTGRLIQLGVRRNTIKRHPSLCPELLHRIGIEAIALPALVEGREYLARVHNHIG